MSYTVPPAAAAPPPRQRPATVTAASYLLYLIALLQLFGLVAVVATMGTMTDVYNEAYQGTELEGFGTVVGVIGFVVAGVALLVFGAGFVTLGILNAKGKNPARIVTWVVAGAGICCFGANLTGPGSFGNFGGVGGTPTDGGPDPAEVQQRVLDALPSWYGPYNLVVHLIALLAAIAVIVLLALPASNRYFRKPQAPQWQPPGYPPIG